MADSAVPPQDHKIIVNAKEVVVNDPQLQEARECKEESKISSSTEPFDHPSKLQLDDLTGNPETGNIPHSNPKQLETVGNPDSTPQLGTASNPNPSPQLGTESNPSPNSQLNTNSNNAGNARDYNYYLPLYKAALTGDWEKAEEFLFCDPDAVNVAISSYQRTALHVATCAGHSKFAKKLIARMTPETLAIRDIFNGDTALHFASVAGITDAAEAMVKKNKDLTQIMNNSGWAPLLHCAAYVAKEQKDMMLFLCRFTRNEPPCMPFSGPVGAQLICNIIAAGLHDVALYLVQRYPNLATERDQTGCTALDVLAQKSSTFPSGSRLGFWQRCIYSVIPLQVDEKRIRRFEKVNTLQNYPMSSRDFSIRGALIKFLSWTYLIHATGIKKVYLTKLAHIQAMELLKCMCNKISLMANNEILQFFLNSNIMSSATTYGIVELVTECIETFPDQLWFLAVGRSIFHIAVEHRQEKIFNLMYGMSAQKKILASWRVEKNNNILHLAAKLAPTPQLNKVSGAALQMQRELQWYKEVEKLVQPTYKELKNNDMDTPREIFTREHKDLLDKGEKWMKDTAQSCTVIAALIVTVVFTAAFTAPGGNISDNNSEDNGVPIFMHTNSFMVFIISDALALFSSTTSVLMFLSILASRYAEEDFLYSLPKRMMIGLATLFFSIATMMIAFSATLSIVLSRRLKWASFPIAAIACLPVTLFALLQFPLFVEIVISTYGPGIFKAERKYKLY